MTQPDDDLVEPGATGKPADAEPSGTRKRGRRRAVDAEAPRGTRNEDEHDHGALAHFVEQASLPVRSVARPIGRRVGRLAAGAQRSFQGSAGQRVRRVRRMGHQPLPNLFEVHPEAHQAFPRTLGLRTVPVAAIRGTAVEGPTQRGGDFLPLKQLRGADWNARWARIRSALDQLIDLPPIDVMRFGDEYWVTDGHNRVGAALYNGQGAIDANVTQLRVPGVASEPTGPIGAYLQGSMDLRAAGEGRLSRTATRPEDWEVLPDAIAGGRGEADPGDEQPAASPPDERGHHHGHRPAYTGPERRWRMGTRADRGRPMPDGEGPGTPGPGDPDGT